jgi:hypothetical protein
VFYPGSGEVGSARATRRSRCSDSGPGRLLDYVMAIEQGDFERANEIVDGASQH